VVAVLDIGSNSVLMLLAEREDGSWRFVYDGAQITRLGEGFEPSHLLQPTAIERTVQAVQEFGHTARTHRVRQVVVLMTAVVREAKNPNALLEPLREELTSWSAPIKWRTLSEQEEAELSYLSVAHDDTLPISFPLAVVDIGGGSVEVAFGELEPPPNQWGEIDFYRSFPIGAVRVREQKMPADPPSTAEVLNCCKWLDGVLEPLQELAQPSTTVLVGGTGVNLGMLALELEAFEPHKVHGLKLTDEQIAQILHHLLQLSDAERSALKGIEPARAPILHVGTLVLERVLFALRQEQVWISTRGIRYGGLYTL